MAKYKLVVEYEGTAYHGFQKQAALPTVQEELEKALAALTGETIRIHGAGRTDTGVHAKGQVVSFVTESALRARAFVTGLNFYLPDDIAVRSVEVVDASFDARHSALSREYRYIVLNAPARSPLWRRFSYHVEKWLDVEAMSTAWRAILGRRDFAAFASTIGRERRSTVRTIYTASVERRGELILLDVGADAFLPHQVRNMVGTVLLVGRGTSSVDEFVDVLASGDRSRAGPAAPAHGLCLMRVNYGTRDSE
ncbi:MAG: tRNA pseudouridine(38-40) synthase TruA [Chloroflexota bacterium]|nr:MAG: tRNA pseudouridine(38-40) synthase TruA [Chloroflexota bacterium]